jgi:hypothetical protein
LLAAAHAVVGMKGETGEIAVLPLIVNVALVSELSTNLLDWHVSRDVPRIAVSGAVGGVKFEV